MRSVAARPAWNHATAGKLQDNIIKGALIIASAHWPISINLSVEASRLNATMRETLAQRSTRNSKHRPATRRPRHHIKPPRAHPVPRAPHLARNAAPTPPRGTDAPWWRQKSWQRGCHRGAQSATRGRHDPPHAPFLPRSSWSHPP